MGMPEVPADDLFAGPAVEPSIVYAKLVWPTPKRLLRLFPAGIDARLYEPVFHPCGIIPGTERRTALRLAVHFVELRRGERMRAAFERLARLGWRLARAWEACDWVERQSSGAVLEDVRKNGPLRIFGSPTVTFKDPLRPWWQPEDALGYGQAIAREAALVPEGAYGLGFRVDQEFIAFPANGQLPSGTRLLIARESEPNVTG